MKFICDHCKKPFYRTPNRIRGTHKFCSRKCTISYFRYHKDERKNVGTFSLAKTKLQNIVALKRMW